MNRPTPLILLILDAFGVSTEKSGNPVFEARHPNLDDIERNYPYTTLQASGLAVGLPWGEAGNSEVGHLTIGSGRVLHHHLPRIISSIHDFSFFENPRLIGAASHVKQHNSRLHIAGLMSSGSVHSYIDHLYALLELTQKQKLPRVFLHAFSDGKDAPPKEGASFLSNLEERLRREWPHARIATVMGRLWAMDRDEKWDRIKKGYELLTSGKGTPIGSVPHYLEDSYTRNITDEFIEPAFVAGDDGRPIGLVTANDALIFMNFREDSMRELTRAFVSSQFDSFPRQRPDNLCVATMTDYEKEIAPLAAFPSPDITRSFSEVLGQEKFRHLHVAETNKYAHVTYFFNGGKETPFPGEERVLVPSVAAPHPDDIPQMRASEITSTIIAEMGNYDVIIANLANADLVGHSGNYKAAIRAVEALDESLGALKNAVLNRGAMLVITGDHGGIEMKRNLISGEKRTEHSQNPVPFLLVSDSTRIASPRTDDELFMLKREVGGIITDVAPTLLDILGLKKPHEMTGTSLLAMLLEQMG